MMPITELLSRNARLYGDEVSLVEINPELQETREVTWREYELIEPRVVAEYRREMTWREFDEKANRFANLLLTRGIEKGDKVAVLLMNCLEWLPIYFGVLKSGAIAVPLNYRYTAEEIKYCLDLAECKVLVFGPEFIGRIETICDDIPNVKHRFFVGNDCPTFAESYNRLTTYCLSTDPNVGITDDDDAAIYFSSGTTGFPKAILHTHSSLMSACHTEHHAHGQTHDIEDKIICRMNQRPCQVSQRL
jgi:long-chain acyl-CoA synthetase